MAANPIILALANPEPEIRPELAKLARPDCIIATGRSDYPNQVNNVLCFPYIFRGALDSGATKITAQMKLACVKEIADLAKAEISEEVASAYAGQELAFGTEYIIPKPFDSRLILRNRAGGGRGGGGFGVATRPHRGSRSLSRATDEAVLLGRHADASGVRCSARFEPQAHRVRRRRGWTAHCARRRWPSMRSWLRPSSWVAPR